MDYEPFTVTKLGSGKFIMFSSIPINEELELKLSTEASKEFTGSGHNWADLFKKFLIRKDKELLDNIVFDCEGSMFSVLIDTEKNLKLLYKYYLEIIEDHPQTLGLYE